MSDEYMEGAQKFPLLSGNISIDLVNTEVVRWGQRHDLFADHTDIVEWLHLVKKDHSFWDEQLFTTIQSRISEVDATLKELRHMLRQQFEAIADQQPISNEFIAFLEQKIERAPFTYKLIEQNLIPFPLGEIEDVLAALVAFDVLTLLKENKLAYIKSCSNDACVLMFIDVSGRRKWCSMKICGNRQKVAKFQQRKIN